MDTLPLAPDDDSADGLLDEPPEEPPGRDWDRPPVLPALGLVLLGVVWLAFLVWPRPPADGSADAGFLRDMIVHHNQAVRMGEITHDGTHDQLIDVLAGDIVTTQQVQVGEMTGWLERWGLPTTSDGPAMAWMGTPVEGLMPGMATADQLANLQTLTDQDLDVAFLTLMTRHHMAGTDMANACLRLCSDDQVRRLARGIVAVQQGEIDRMNEMLVERGQPAVTADGMTMAGMDMTGRSGVPSSGEMLRSVVAKAIRALPVVFGLVALWWLAIDAVARRRRWDDRDDLPPTAMLVGLGAAVASSALHAGLIPGFLDLGTDLGLFHGVVVVLQAAVVAAAIASRRRGVALGGAAVGLIVIAAWAVLRLVAPADGDDGRFDLAVTVAMATEAVQAAALFWAWRQSAEPANNVEAVPAGA